MREVRTEQGLLAGSERAGVFEFLGIPYAAPPVGDLRWAPPRLPAVWDGVRAATAFGNAAVQTIGTGFGLHAEQSEDCLYLNIWSPAPDAQARQPVMVWIHGGGFLNGAASMSEWTGESLAAKGVTVVSLNYRLGAFGFLCHPDAGTNFAVLDWVAALHWVTANIAAFGGDPNNVTIFGQSAGAAAVRTLLSTPAARGLFRHAIIQSAGYENYAVVESPSRNRLIRHSEAVFARLGSRDLETLRSVPAEAVRAASLAESGIIPPAGQVHTPANLVWYPTVDGIIVAEGFAAWLPGVTVLFGTTRDEARFFHRPTGLYARPDISPEDVYRPATLETMAKVLAGERAAEVLAYYAAKKASPYEALAELSTNAIWLEPALATYRRFAALDRRSYSYHFARVSPGTRRSGLLAYHSAEIPYIFGSVSASGSRAALGGTAAETSAAAPDTPAFDDVDVALSVQFQHAWAEFARTGVPRRVDGAAWPACLPGDPMGTVIGDTVEFRLLEISAVTTLISSERRGGATT